jgi:hypothetical protein
MRTFITVGPKDMNRKDTGTDLDSPGHEYSIVKEILN